MKFIDEAVIHVKAGHGGSGVKSFRREKFVAFGGPDGGDGGRGGNITVTADRNYSTLLDFQHRPNWEAGDGEPGQGSGKAGRDGKDIEIIVPVGTQVLEYAGTDELGEPKAGPLVTDLNHHGASFLLAKGGRGGKGNAFFKTATNRVPEHFQPGEDGGKGSYLLSLKLVAEVALLGFPNAGKSTLLSRISSARPKVADYPFTTLTPQLGVVTHKGAAPFVVADVPGLIEGAHVGKGLGIKFLKHLERSRILIHLIDPMQFDEKGERVEAAIAFQVINQELASFSPELSTRPRIVALTKEDSAPPEVIAEAVKSLEDIGVTPLVISAATGKGMEALLDSTIALLAEQRSQDSAHLNS